jgi:HAD superfamily hydrolase (TIGR01509 family)
VTEAVSEAVTHSPMRTTPPDLIIFDFDGVVVDSELLSNTMLAEFLTQEGLPTTIEQAISHYMGRRWPDNQARIREQFGRALPDDFFARYSAFEDGRMRRDVQAVAGVQRFLAAHSTRKLCVASSSSISWLDHGVDKFDLRGALGRNLFSATEVKNGKPAPDIFLHAAAKMGIAPEKCAVLEDSAAGVQGGVAAGMTTIGFLGGAHIRDGHGEKLLAAGAHALARDYDEVARILKLDGAAV